MEPFNLKGVMRAIRSIDGRDQWKGKAKPRGGGGLKYEKESGTLTDLGGNVGGKRGVISKRENKRVLELSQDGRLGMKECRVRKGKGVVWVLGSKEIGL